MSCEPPFWRAQPPAPERTREQALELAEEIARQAAFEPDRFAQLAMQYSEDVTTQALGGQLGAIKPFTSTSCPQILDALGVLRVGEVSRVVETSYGWHVLRREPPPLEQRVSGSRIIIGYDDAPWLAQHLARRPIPPRSRARALEVAYEIYAQVKSDPRSFARLADRYSEHEDALRGGDFGSWSTREFSPFPREVHALTKLAVGEPAPPLDSMFGFQIILRTPDRPRQRFAAERIELAFDPTLPPSSPKSESQVRNQAFEIARALRRNPEAITQYQLDFCCGGTLEWVEGRGTARYEEALRLLAIDEVTAVPVRLGRAYALLRKRLPGPEREARVNLELPTPEQPALGFLALTAAGPDRFEREAKALLPLLQLDSNVATQCASLTAIQVRLAELPDEDLRESAFRETEARLRALMGETSYQRFANELRRRLSHFVLERARDEPLPIVDAL